MMMITHMKRFLMRNLMRWKSMLRITREKKVGLISPRKKNLRAKMLK